MLHLVTLHVLLALAPTSISEDGYRLPPQAIVDLVDAAPPPSVRLSPDGQWMLLLEQDALPTLADVSRPMLRLAGMRIDPEANARHRTDFIKRLSLRAIGGGEADVLAVPLPPGGRLAEVDWSHDSRHFVFTVFAEDGAQLWSADVESAAEPRLLTERLNTVLGGPTWMPDGRSVICRLVPEDRGAAPTPPRVPRGPSTQSTAGDETPLRTYQDLLSSPYDEQLFAYYATTRLAHVDVASGEVTPLGEPALYAAAEPSPGGRHLLVTLVRRPFSYLMPWSSFPHEIAVWLPGGGKHVVADVPLEEGVPIDGVPLGPRNVQWKPGEDATLVWVEALDGGDPKAEVPHRDRWLSMSLAGEEPTEARELFRVATRAWGLTYFADTQLVISHEYDRDRRWVRSLLHDLGRLDAAPRVLEDRSIRDRYGDPGDLQLRFDATGQRIVQQDGDYVYRTGRGASPVGDLPFLDRQDLATLATERMWRCEEGAAETVVHLYGLAEDGETLNFVTRRETPLTPPNYHLRQLSSGASPKSTHFALTEFQDPTPQIRGIKQQLITYERADGVPLSATLYLPADYEEGRRLPLFVWAYPIEFNDAATAGQVSGSPWRFTRIAGASHLALLTQGYAVLDGATMPIIGDPETMNDKFIEQVVAAAAAAIDKASDLGVGDRTRVAVGGHSYGAFMTANLLAHCDLFRAGVARSGAYNRTLTPFGFQSERRTIWEAPEAYFEVSPFFHADEINEPLLLIHGEVDNNSGTFPMQSERLFQAIKGNGGTARLVLLPNESHGYRARESVLHVQAETLEWLDAHVKGVAVEEVGLEGEE